MLSLLLAMALGAGADGSAEAPSKPLWGLRWAAPEGCLPAAELVRQVEQRLGYPVFGANAPRMVDGRVERAGQGWRASLVLVDAQGTILGSRELTQPSSDCRALDGSLSLVVAVMIDPEAALRRPGATPPAPEAEPPAAAPGPPLAPPEPEAPPGPVPARPPSLAFGSPLPRRTGPHSVEVDFAGTVSVGALPGIAPGLALAFWFRGGRGWPFELRGELFPYARYEAPAGSKAELLSVGLDALTCPAWGGGPRWVLSACAGLDADVLYVRSEGFQQRAEEMLVRSDVLVRGRATWRLGDLAGLTFAATGGWAILHPRMLLLSSNGTARREPAGEPFFAAADLGLALPFP